MCTVAVLSLPDGGYVLGHNRDERLTRSRGSAPRIGRAGGVAFLAPGDPDGGGSWIGVNEAGIVACLLNAAEPPGRTPPADPPSRGLLVREAMACRSLGQAVSRFSGREADWRARRAFDLVIVAPGGPGEPAVVARLASNGVRAAWDRPPLPALFTSSTFDGTGVGASRRRAWERFLADAREPAAALGGWLAGHEPDKGPYSVCMHRTEARTVSRTLVAVGPGGITLDYVDGPPCSPEGPGAVVTL